MARRTIVILFVVGIMLSGTPGVHGQRSSPNDLLPIGDDVPYSGDVSPNICLEPNAVEFNPVRPLTTTAGETRLEIDLDAIGFDIVPGATYEVILVSYDEHTDDGEVQDQEIWRVELSLGGGAPLYTSPETLDLPDDVDWATYAVDNEATVAGNVDTVTAVHRFDGVPPPGTAESVWPVCAVFEPVGDPPPSGIAVEKATNGVDADDPLGGDVPQVDPGDVVAWTYVVTNTGSAPVGDVVVVDDQLGIVVGPVSGDGNEDGLLDVGEVWVYEVSGVAEDLEDTTLETVDGCPDISGNLRPTYVNVATVSGEAGAVGVSGSDPSHYCNPPPVEPPLSGIAVEKATNGVDADDPLGGDVPQVDPGDVVAWTYVVTNTGSAPVGDVVVVDDQLGIVAGPASGDGNDDGLLDVDEEWIYEASGLAEDLGATAFATVDGCPDISGNLRPTYRNTVVVSGSAGTGTVETDDLSHYCNPPASGLVVEKATNGADADDPSGDDVPRLEPGDLVTWTYVVSNAGEEPATDVALVDDQLGVIDGPTSGDANGDGLLDVGEQWVYEASGVAEDLGVTALTTVDGCAVDGAARPTYRNTVAVSGSIGGETVVAEDLSHYCNAFEGVPVLILDTMGEELGPLEQGDRYTYVADAHNLGSAAVTGLTLEISVPPEVQIEGVAGANCGTGALSSSGETVGCEGIDIGPGGVFRAEVTVVVSSDVDCVVLARAVLSKPATLSNAATTLSENGEPTILAGSRDLVAPAFDVPMADEALALASGAVGSAGEGGLAATGRNLGPLGILAFTGIALGSALVAASRLTMRNRLQGARRHGE